MKNNTHKKKKPLHAFAYLFLILSVFFTVSCKKKKIAFPLWMAALMGEQSSSSSSTDSNSETSSNQSTDSNGETLPSATNSVSDDGSDSNGTSSSQQEVATSGPVVINGTLLPQINGLPICAAGQSPGSPANCSVESGTALDLTRIKVKLIRNNGGEEEVIAETFLNADGSYQFDVADLANGDYRVLTNAGDGLNYTYQDFQFTYNPTELVNGKNQIDLADMTAERLYYTSGAAVLTGNVRTPGFSGDVTIPTGALSGVTVNLKDSNGTVIATSTSDADGTYAFCFNDSASCPTLNGATPYSVNEYLANGKYTVEVLGSSAAAQHGRTFQDESFTERFSFSGNDQNTATNLTFPNANLDWNAATSSSATVNLTVNNAANSDTTTSYTIKLKDASGNVIKEVTRTGSGAVSLATSDMAAGVYTVEVSSGNSITSTSSFNFIPHSAGANKTIDIGTVNVVPKPSTVLGSLQGPGGSPNPVPGAVINFRPASTQAPSRLAYLALATGDEAKTVRLRNLANLWLREACSQVAACQTNCAAGGYQVSCVIANQGTGPSWTYSTYANAVYEVNGTQLSMQAVAGTWEYYISAPGYENTTTSTMVLNGQDITVPSITMTPSAKRSRIKGSVSVLDRLVGSSSYTAHNNFSGLFAVMLGNTDNFGNPVAHVTTTAAGAFEFDGNSKVVSLAGVTDLNGDGQIDDTDRVLYATSAYGSAPTLANANTVSGVGVGNSVDATNGYYNFKQSSYQLILADPLGHVLTTPKQADNSAVVGSDYSNGSRVLDLAGIQVLHQSRRQISGSITDAISTGAVSGATVTLGTMVNGSFQATVRRDCTGSQAANSNSCTPSTVRTPGSDQIVPPVTTDSNGNYVLKNINPGDYVIKVSKNGIDTYVPVTVSSTGDSVANIQVITSNGRGNLTGNVRTPNSSGALVNFTGTYSLEIVHPNFSTRPTTGVQPASLVSGMTTFSNVPNYNVFSVNAGSWKVRFVSAGYVTVEAMVNIQADATTTLDIVALVPGYQPPATVSGRALSALTNQGLGGLTVRIRSGVNVTSGSYVGGAVTTGSDGSYALPDVPAGNYTMEVSGSGVATTYRTIVSAGPDTPPNQNILVSPVLGADEVRVVLSWEAKPRDLDSHLEFGSARPQQVVWNDKCQLPDTNKRSPSACLGTEDLTLDIDVVNGYGPETVTMKGSIWTQSRRGYSVFNWSNEATMAVSGATVKVFKSSGLVRSYAVSSSQISRWWRIFCLDANKNIIDVGQSGCKASDFFDASYN
ncbi:MAG: carboxypeptidase regulatory-like domain-containing protein [Spirochaetota bacterium]